MQRHELTEARMLRAVVLYETGHTLADWQVAKRTRAALEASRIFAYLTRKLIPAVPLAQIAQLAVWSEDSARLAIKAAARSETTRLTADAIASKMMEHTR